jgi:hypothetical protein
MEDFRKQFEYLIGFRIPAVVDRRPPVRPS